MKLDKTVFRVYTRPMRVGAFTDAADEVREDSAAIRLRVEKTSDALRTMSAVVIICAVILVAAYIVKDGK